MRTLLFSALLMTSPAVASSPSLHLQDRVPDAELAKMRGGIRLPNGAEVAVGIAIETQVNGTLALRTQYSSEQSGVRVYAGGPALVQSDAADGSPPTPTIIYDRNAAGSTVTVASSQPTLNVSMAPSGVLPPAAGEALPVAVDGSAVPTSLGNVSLSQSTSGFTTTLASPTLLVQQLIGNATGVVVANTANDQIINTQTWVSVDIQGFVPPPGLASSLAQAASAVAQR
jgi:hypothetical protein